jgi:hypothetical protein
MASPAAREPGPLSDLSPGALRWRMPTRSGWWSAGGPSARRVVVEGRHLPVLLTHLRTGTLAAERQYYERATDRTDHP